MNSGTIKQLETKTLLLFFIPLGISASLVTLSHLIINSTLARAENSELIISSYAIAMSLFAITERLAVILRQTCSTLVRDKNSFKLMTHFAFYLIGGLLLISLAIAYTSLGDFIFLNVFGVKENMVTGIKEIYQVLIYVTIFSGLRCLCHGIIIFNRQTKWLTIGMVIRLIGMYLLSLYFIKSGNITAVSGAYIFLVGMIIECIISMIEALSLLKKMPVNSDLKIKSNRQIFRFYNPLMLSSFITVLIGPAINVFLGKTGNIELAIASYAIALGVTQLFISFFSYIHQIVINFYDEHENKIKRFSLIIGFIPFVIIAVFCFTEVGALFLRYVMGVDGRLLEESLKVLKIFLIMAIVFPFVDFFNGILMLHRQTKVTIVSQSTNLIITLIFLGLGVTYASEWNGAVGAFAQSIGILSELIVVSLIVNSIEKSKGRKSIFVLKRIGKENLETNK
ncbi:multi antimicrobial extrusion protein MatE [Litchfieldia salsa]|uniref:Na+-driven multidrug efflux pump n=1 Tax=Litchfieldia salsa TaxID=930152 RepID=A0A1H0WYK0_9BACI|nr:multi antimicrobial extrusion protein MatE [Litchfieldia salsa]SDP95783.1 Na+-driven multidrug efflux pump [Litchfieldia salsa]